MQPLFYLTSIAVLLLLGILCSVIANRLKIPNVLLLILTGIIFNYIQYDGKSLINFSTNFLASISIIALAMILFDSSSRLKLKTFDSLSFKAFKLVSVFFLYNILFLTIPTILIFNISAGSLFNSVLLALVFTSLISATDSISVLVLLKGVKSRVARLLEIESIINTPLAIILPFMFIDMISKSVEFVDSTFLINQILPFLAQIVVGIGSGVFVGIIIFKLMRKKFSEQLSPVALITAALLTYIIAENLQGSGVLAVVALGLFFGNVYVKQKETLKEFSSMFSNSLEILVFILVGFSVKIPLTHIFFIKSFALFILYLIIRFLAVNFTFRVNGYSLKEKFFMTLNVSKGIAVAVVTFTLLTKDIAGIDQILPLILIFMVYSIATATFAEKYALKFLSE